MARRFWYSDRDYIPPARLIRATGGIRAQGGRGQLGGSQWWAKRWIAVLEGFHLGGRLTRGRAYARGGQVLDIVVGSGEATARVQGSRARPYLVTLRFRTLSGEEWGRVADCLRSRAAFLARLLSGEMPEDIEEAFEAANASLFVARSNDLVTDCSCPDYANPCKHIAAVFCVLGEEFDRDPFLLFRLRGLTREQLLERLAPPADAAAADAAPAEETLDADPAAFWHVPVRAPLPADLSPPSPPAPLLRHLGDLPFWKGREPLYDSLVPRYLEAADRAIALLTGVSPEDD